MVVSSCSPPYLSNGFGSTLLSFLTRVAFTMAPPPPGDRLGCPSFHLSDRVQKISRVTKQIFNTSIYTYITIKYTSNCSSSHKDGEEKNMSIWNLTADTIIMTRLQNGEYKIVWHWNFLTTIPSTPLGTAVNAQLDQDGWLNSLESDTLDTKPQTNVKQLYFWGPSPSGTLTKNYNPQVLQIW
jgi:hypothetical protein